MDGLVVQAAAELWVETEREAGSLDGYEEALAKLQALRPPAQPHQQQQQAGGTAAASEPLAPPTPRSAARATARSEEAQQQQHGEARGGGGKGGEKRRGRAEGVPEDDGQANGSKRARTAGTAGPQPQPQPSNVAAAPPPAAAVEHRWLVFVKHLGGKVSEPELQAALEAALGSAEAVLRVKVGTDRATGRRAGHAVVTLASHEHVHKAIGTTTHQDRPTAQKSWR